MVISEAIQIAGLIFDGSGAAYIAQGFFVTTPDKISKAAGMAAAWDANPGDLVKLIMQQRNEAVIGGTLLILGFFVQLLGVISGYSEWGKNGLSFIYFICLAIIIPTSIYSLITAMKRYLQER